MTVFTGMSLSGTPKLFFELHEAILRAYEFDNKHKATFFRSNDHWQKGREISLEVYEKDYKAAPLLMKDTTVGNFIKFLVFFLYFIL